MPYAWQMWLDIVKYEIIILVWPNEGIQMQLAAQLSYQLSLDKPWIVDDLPKAEEPNRIVSQVCTILSQGLNC